MANMTKKPKGKMSNTIRLSLFWAILVLATVAAWALATPRGELKDVAISEVISRANKGEVSKIEGLGNDLQVTVKGQNKPTEKSYLQGGISTLIKEKQIDESKTKKQSIITIKHLNSPLQPKPNK